MSTKQGVTLSQSAGPRLGLLPNPVSASCNQNIPACPLPPSHNDAYFLWADLVTQVSRSPPSEETQASQSKGRWVLKTVGRRGALVGL